MKLTLAGISVQLPGMDRELFRIRELSVASGERVLIQGPSGRGKTTLLHLMAGLVAPKEGVVQLDGANLWQMSETDRSRLRRQQVGIVFQKLNLIGHLTADENVQLASAHSSLALPLDALRLVGVADCAAVLAQSLSLGQSQRVAVARVLHQRPQLILADEPTSSLDDENSNVVLGALLKMKQGTTMVVVSHDSRIRDRFDRVVDFSQLVKA